ncbi:MAG: CCA tRNA nucleotidyltransferase [Clostridiales bacterium]|nr:CCA tRNA nucleotidyltransferase [Clostridiales bacterium]
MNQKADINLQIPDSASSVIHRLNAHGHEAYVVGGCVRDTLLERNPNDWDVTTSAHPDEVFKLFDSTISENTAKPFKAIATGLKHGTVTVLSHGEPVEVTTFRVDGEYTDCRRPDSVQFTSSLEADLSRRDFTINAMAYSPATGLVDLFGGRDDLSSGIVRCVGKPERRFSEDALRILRTLRFASVLGFRIDDDTANAAISLRGLLNKISRERISVELDKLLCGKNTARILIDFRQIIETIIPELADCAEYERAVKLVSISSASTPIKLAALFSEISPEIAATALTHLRFDKKTCTRVRTICSHLHDKIDCKSSVKRLCCEVGLDCAENIIELAAQSGRLENKYRDIVHKIRENDECISISQLKINGDKLITLGVKPESIGRILAKLLDEVINERLSNDECALTKFVMEEFMQKKALVIINQHTAKPKLRSDLLEILNIFTKSGYACLVRPTQKAGDAAQYTASNGSCFDLVVCAGGDGTLNEVVSGLCAIDEDKRPPVGYIPAGTTNDFAASIGLFDDPIEAAWSIMGATPCAMDCGRINGHIFNYIASFGAFTEVSYGTPQPLKNMFGHFAYLLEGAKHLTDIKSYHLKLTLQNDNTESVIEDDFAFGAFANTLSIGGVIHLDPSEVDLGDGMHEYLLVKMPKSIAELNEAAFELRALQNSERRNKSSSKLVMYGKFTRGRLESLDGAEEISWSLDGECVRTSADVEIENLHAAYCLMK